MTSRDSAGTRPRLSRRRASLGLLGVALLCSLFADFQVIALEPWAELQRMLMGLLLPDFLGASDLLSAVLLTVAFAVLGTFAGALGGFGLALCYQWRAVRLLCAFMRAIHELFWALIFLQLFGLGPVTGLLAIAIPYSGIFAKVYSEILEEADSSAWRALPSGSGRISAFVYARIAAVWPQIRSYSYYRLECGLRSSAVLGFVGLPTLGFYLESAFAQGYYHTAGAYLLLLFLLVGSIRLWLPVKLVLPAALLSAWLLPAGGHFSWANIGRFFSHDIVPAPLRPGGDASEFWPWLTTLLQDQALPGVINTVIVTQVAVVTTGLLTLLLFPLASRRFCGRIGSGFGHLLLLVLRSTPEYVLAFVLLQIWGPSMLPAVVALTLHNGAIIGFLIGRYSDQLPLRPDAPRGVNLYAYEVLPRAYGQFLAFLFYRWEIIMRETAVLGILGVHTLGFFVDSAIAEIRFDRAVILLLITAALNMLIDACSRTLRSRMQLTQRADCR